MPEAFAERTADSQTINPEVLHRAWSLRDAGWIPCAATNQSGIGRGVRTVAEAVETLRMTDRLCGGLFARMLYCPPRPPG